LREKYSGKENEKKKQSEIETRMNYERKMALKKGRGDAGLELNPSRCWLMRKRGTLPFPSRDFVFVAWSSVLHFPSMFQVNLL
jgi:hypothetical protein